MKKTAKIEFKLEQELFQKYKDFCDNNGHTMSKRLRKFIEEEVTGINNKYEYEKDYQKIKNKSSIIVETLCEIYFPKDGIEVTHEYFTLRKDEFKDNLTRLKFLFLTNQRIMSNLMDNFENTDEYYEIMSNLVTNITYTLTEITKYVNDIEVFFKNYPK